MGYQVVCFVVDSSTDLDQGGHSTFKGPVEDSSILGQCFFLVVDDPSRFGLGESPPPSRGANGP